jgi:hypothetical protein
MNAHTSITRHNPQGLRFSDWNEDVLRHAMICAMPPIAPLSSRLPGKDRQPKPEGPRPIDASVRARMLATLDLPVDRITAHDVTQIGNRCADSTARFTLAAMVRIGAIYRAGHDPITKCARYRRVEGFDRNAITEAVQ